MLFKVYCIINGVIIVAIQVRAHLFEYQREISRGDANSDENLTQIATRHISDDSSTSDDIRLHKVWAGHRNEKVL